MKIVIAEDDAVVRALLHRVAEFDRHDAFLAEDGRQALEIIEREDPDMLITDLRMPELDGFGLIDALRALPKHRRMPIICLSSVNSSEDVSALIERGISDYVLKPARPADLAQRIRAVAARERYWKANREPFAPAQSAKAG